MSIQVNRTSKRSKVSCSTPSFVQEPCPTIMPTIPPKYFSIHLAGPQTKCTLQVSLGRAARTDAGVHAAGNVVSMKLIVNIPGVKDWVARINEELPPEIRVWGKVSTCLPRRAQHQPRPNRFAFRADSMRDCMMFFFWRSLYVVLITISRSCDSRKYTYFFPSYLLIPPKPSSAFVRSQPAAAATTSWSLSNNTPRHPSWDFPGADSSSPEQDLARKRQWRVSAEDVDNLRATAKKFEGTHNFHNFTVGRDFSDRSNQRHMIKLQVRLFTMLTEFPSSGSQIADPAVYGDTEWISVLFHGQSFMLHQVLSPCVSRSCSENNV